MFSSFFGKVVFVTLILMGVVIIFLFATVGSLRTENADLYLSLADWQQKYKTMEIAQQETEAENADLRKSVQDLEASLSSWKGRYEEIQTGYARTQEQLRQLRAENPGVRDFLDTAVPFDLWRVLFPEQYTGNGADYQDGKSEAP